MSAIGQLVSGVAHELNNPLAGISAFAQLLLTEKRLSQEQRGASETIYAESRRASRIVNNLLTFARQYKPEKGPTALNQVLDDTLELRAYELRVRGIEINRDYDESIPDTMADAHQLQQVFLNLFTNAEQSMERAEGRPHRLTVRTRRAGRSVRIEIEDTGPGIPPALLDRIFNPFFTTKPTGSGTGLGLSISLGIVREHEGRIWAENLQGAGARFIIELPITKAVPSGEHTSLPLPAPISERLRILVVDDEASVRLALQRYLEGRGHQVESSSSGLDAVARLGATRYDAVILDLRMPDLPGEELFKRLQENDPEHAQRVIFMTGDLLGDHMQAFLDRTGRPFVRKPFEFTAFDQALPAARRR
jgi:two-component system NtrC family sensor kinase